MSLVGVATENGVGDSSLSGLGGGALVGSEVKLECGIGVRGNVASMAPEVYKKLVGGGEASGFTDIVSGWTMSMEVCAFHSPLHRVIKSFIVPYLNRTYRIIATEFAIFGAHANNENDRGQFPSLIPLERGCRGRPNLDKSMENRAFKMFD
ncbi:hypothetical protein Tco_0065718 [Tanacetum coccineum]